MLTIRLQRTGRENLPTYRLVVAQSSKPVKGKFLEIVGHYLPARDPAVFQHDADRIKFWIAKGAIPSDTLARLLRRAGMEGMDKFIKKYTKKKPRNEEAAAPAAPAAAPAEAPAAPVAEAPAEAAPAA